ncbi:MAG: hypothetical protein JXB34_02920 [Bacteroidales bacterium]|nr:hypothetical protein [Bacteroidales bacterium]
MSLLGIDVIKVSAVLFLLGGSIIALSKELKQILFASKKKFFLYLLLLTVLFFIGGIFSIRQIIGDPLLGNNILIQIWLIIAGFIHIWAGNTLFKWNDAKKALHFFVFSLIASFWGSIVFLFTVRYLGLGDLQFFFWSNIVLFFFPYSLLMLVQSAFEIPTPIFERWYYPDKRKIARPEKDELRNPILVTLQLVKHPGGPTSKIKAKAPENMAFGRFFFHFVNDYNLHNPESPIAITDNNEKTCGWAFYSKSGIFGGWRSVNTEHSILNNRLKEDVIVLCERVEEKD